MTADGTTATGTSATRRTPIDEATLVDSTPAEVGMAEVESAEKPSAPVRGGRRGHAGGAGDSEGEAHGQGRFTAERVTFAMSVLIVLTLVGLTTYFHLTDEGGPAVIEIVPDVEQSYQNGTRFYLPVRVANTGQAVGEDVRVTVTLTDSQGTRESAPLEIRFLPAGASSRGVASFRSDPRAGQISIDGVSYMEP